MTSPLTFVSWNFENNGKNDPDRRRKGDEKVKSLKPDIVFRQEMWDAADHGDQIFSEAKQTLEMQGKLGKDSCTAIFFNPDKFVIVRDWEKSRGPVWVLPPTALTMRYLPAGPDALPLVMVSYHLNYGSPTQRAIEAEWLTTWADKGWQAANEQQVTLPALMAGDNNSYPAPGPGDLALPVLEKIKNRPHRLHRSVRGSDGTRRMDVEPDDVLRTAGLEDIARHWADQGHETAVARTVNASPTHGPDSRVDRVYATPELLPALTGVEVIEVEDLSDHHIVRFTLDPDGLIDILQTAAAPARAS
ncbi:endonuclease/exonuclease/phosphatase family protein [Streptomyces sp. NPDC021212]|uniref:endonuclease/exonuclease/phosphatase family protein n=1 Tax=Streptomyces sp. NPDC021212 TaxID=3365118 RepID=UPI0037A14886